jgi:apoptosis-inducing factor 3
LQQFHEKNGVKFHMGAKIEKLVPSSADAGAVGGIVVGGNTIEADAVVMGTGVAPATQFLKDSGLKVEQDGGILVDQYLRVPGYDNVFAIGKSLTNRSRFGNLTALR